MQHVKHFLETPQCKGYRLRSQGARHIAGALCGNGMYFMNNRNNFTANPTLVTCEECKAHQWFNVYLQDYNRLKTKD